MTKAAIRTERLLLFLGFGFFLTTLSYFVYYRLTSEINASLNFILSGQTFETRANA